MDAFVARQPILDRRRDIVGYELLFRGDNQSLPQLDGDAATYSVLSNSFLAIGMDYLAGGTKAFINFTQNLLTRKIPMFLPKESMVIEILENVEPTPALIESCREMADHGYTLALDDFVYRPVLGPLIDLAHIIKYDFKLSSPDEVQKSLENVFRRKRLRLLAEKVETNKDFESALAMGFDMFQGFFFCEPEVLAGKAIQTSRLNAFNIIGAINQPDFEFEQIEKMISPDIGLSYKLMRYINSAFFSRAQRISSIRQALVQMGKLEIRRFVSLIAMADLSSGKPDELMRAACTRAKFCELLWPGPGAAVAADQLFILGLFSLIDALLDQSMASIMARLPLNEAIKRALMERKGPLAPYLVLIEYYERGHWAFVAKLAEALSVDERKLPGSYLLACRWADAVMQAGRPDHSPER